MNNHQPPLCTASPELALETTPSSHRTSSSDGTPKNFFAIVEDVAGVKLSVTRVQDKQASFVNSSSTKQSQLNAGAASSRTYAGNAYSYLADISSGTFRYTRWVPASLLAKAPSRATSC